MKNIILIALITLGMNVMAQITLEHDYDSASTFASGAPALQDQLMIINFEVSGEKFVKIDRHGKKICIYNINYSLLKTIDFSSFPIDSFNPNQQDIFYFSEKLFDMDDEIEFVFTKNALNSNSCWLGIYNENGSLIFSDTASMIIRPNTQLQQYPIYNTAQGTKMILSYPNGHAKVFSLPGTLSTAIAEANGQLMQAQGGQGQFSNLYPNPSNGAVTLQYKLPKGEQEGEIILYNTQGAEVKRYKVDGTFKDIIIDNTMLPAGTYFYQLQTSKGSVGVKKMVVVK